MIDDEKITKHLQHLAKKARRIRSTSAHQMARAPADMLY
jgi:predicted transcriptional regulator